MQPIPHAHILIADVAPGKALESELLKFISEGHHVTLNVNRINNFKSIETFQKVRCINFDIMDHSSLIDILTKDKIGYHVLKTRTNFPINQHLIKAASSPQLQYPLKIIAQAGVSISHIDFKAATECNVIVTNTPGSNANAVAEFVLAQILSLTRNICFHNSESHLHRWSKDMSKSFCMELFDKTLGLVGVGNVAKQLIPKAKALGLNLVAIGGDTFTNETANKLGIKKAVNLDHLLMLSDFVSLHVSLTEKTKYLIGSRELKKMKKGSILINTSRGGIVNEFELACELQNENKNIAAAAIDTFENERSTYDSPLIGLDNVLLTPHIAGSTPEALYRSSSMITKNIISLLKGNADVHICNKEVLNISVNPETSILAHS